MLTFHLLRAAGVGAGNFRVLSQPEPPKGRPNEPRHNPTSPFSITKTLIQMWGKCQSPWLECGGLPATTGYNPTHICYAHFCTQGKVEHCSTSNIVHVTAWPRDELFSKGKMLCGHVIQSWAAVGKCVCS